MPDEQSPDKLPDKTASTAACTATARNLESLNVGACQVAD